MGIRISKHPIVIVLMSPFKASESAILKITFKIHRHLAILHIIVGLGTVLAFKVLLINSHLSPFSV